MTNHVHVVCPHCGTVNRLEPSRLGSGGRCGKCKQALFTGQPLELDEVGFEHHVRRNDIPVLVDFWAPWCGPCKMMAPAYQQAAAQLEPHYRLAKLDTERAQAIAARYGIRSIPTLVLFRGGREVARQAGAMDTGSIMRWVRSQGSG